MALQPQRPWRGAESLSDNPGTDVLAQNECDSLASISNDKAISSPLPTTGVHACHEALLRVFANVSALARTGLASVRAS